MGKSGESSGREAVDSLQEKNMKVEEYSKRQQQVRQWKVNDEAEKKALDKAEGMLAKTRVMALVSRRQTKGR